MEAQGKGVGGQRMFQGMLGGTVFRGKVESQGTKTDDKKGPGAKFSARPQGGEPKGASEAGVDHSFHSSQEGRANST